MWNVKKLQVEEVLPSSLGLQCMERVGRGLVVERGQGDKVEQQIELEQVKVQESKNAKVVKNVKSANSTHIAISEWYQKMNACMPSSQYSCSMLKWHKKHQHLVISTPCVYICFSS